MTKFSSLSLNDIKSFCKVISKYQFYNIDHINKIYSRNIETFNVVTKFLIAVNLIQISSNIISLSSTFSSFIDTLKNNSASIPIENVMVSAILQKNSSFAEYVSEYLGNYSENNGVMEFKPHLTNRVLHRDLRNFLIEIGFIRFDDLQNKYLVNEVYNDLFNKFINSRRISKSQLARQLSDKQVLGDDAELAVFYYEKERLSLHPNLVEKIDHVAAKYVNLGYDILSYESIDGIEMKRYMKVS